MKKIVFGLVVQLLGWVCAAQAQRQIAGVVTDKTTAPVANATVRLLNTSYAVMTDKSGHFAIANLLPGVYTLAVSSTGFAQEVRTVNVQSGNQDLKLTVTPAPAMLDEVVVTAQKTEELSQKVPVSISTITARQVEEYRIWNAKDIAAIVPNLYSADPGDKRNVTAVRGIATTSYDPAIATYIDGVNQFSLDTYISPLFDIERIEVLRGPQGTLYGRNAMGGVINIITKQPDNKTAAFANITMGNYGLQRYSAGVRTALVKDKLFFGATGLYDGFNGFYINEFNNSHFDKQHSISGNYFLKYVPTGRLSFTLNAKHNNNRNNGTFPLVNGVEDALANPFKLNQNALTKMIDNTFNASLSATYNGRYFNLSAQSAYQTNYRYYTNPIDGDFSPIDGVTLINNYGKDWNKVKVFSQELKLSSPAATASKLKWTLGAYYFHQDNPTKQATRFGADAAFVGADDTNFSLINITRAKSRGLATYGQLSYAITPQLSIIGGLRYDHEKKTQSVLGQYQHDPNPDPVFDFRSDTAAAATFHAISPKVALQYGLSQSSNLFGSYSRGFRAGGLTPLSSDPSQPPLYKYLPEYSNNFEAGVKNTFLANRLMVNVTAFYTTISDAQVPTLVLPDAVTITRNTGSLSSKGVELETSGTFSGFRFDYNFGYTHATYKSFIVPKDSASSINLRGNRQIYTPDITSMLGTQYSLPISKAYHSQLTFRAEWKHIGKQYFDVANTISQGNYDLLNARIEVSTPNVSLSLWGRNLGNKRFISYAYDFGAVHLGDPRTFGLTAGFKW